jgi:hypothetical protein
VFLFGKIGYFATFSTSFFVMYRGHTQRKLLIMDFGKIQTLRQHLLLQLLICSTSSKSTERQASPASYKLVKSSSIVSPCVAQP